jgi:hypothetical protein
MVEIIGQKLQNFLLWEQGVAGSNPAAPIDQTPQNHYLFTAEQALALSPLSGRFFKKSRHEKTPLLGILGNYG